MEGQQKHAAPLDVKEKTFNELNVPLFSAFTFPFTNAHLLSKSKFKELIQVQNQFMRSNSGYMKFMQSSHPTESLQLSQSQENIENFAQHLSDEEINKLYKPLVVVGPSGAGKGTLISELVANYKEKFGFSVSFTTRAPRAGEEHGKHYFFVTVDEFQRKIEADDFIEYCKVHTNYYGTEKAQIRDFQRRGIIPLLDIDIQGAKKVYKAFPETNFIFICPPSIEALRERLMKRLTESEASLNIRLKNAEKEITECLFLKQMIQYRVVNEDLEKAKSTFNKLVEVLYEKELGLDQDFAPQRNLKDL